MPSSAATSGQVPFPFYLSLEWLCFLYCHTKSLSGSDLPDRALARPPLPLLGQIDSFIYLYIYLVYLFIIIFGYYRSEVRQR